MLRRLLRFQLNKSDQMRQCWMEREWKDARGIKHSGREAYVYACWTCAKGITDGAMMAIWHGPPNSWLCVHMPRPWFYRLHLWWYHGYGEKPCVQEFLDGKSEGMPFYPLKKHG